MFQVLCCFDTSLGFGQLGLGDKNGRTEPTLLLSLSHHRTVRVSAGANFTIAVMESTGEDTVARWMPAGMM